MVHVMEKNPWFIWWIFSNWGGSPSLWRNGHHPMGEHQADSPASWLIQPTFCDSVTIWLSPTNLLQVGYFHQHFFADISGVYVNKTKDKKLEDQPRRRGAANRQTGGLKLQKVRALSTAPWAQSTQKEVLPLTRIGRFLFFNRFNGGECTANIKMLNGGLIPKRVPFRKAARG